jgi:hypothetical protein
MAIFMSNTYIEIFSDKINGWINFDFNQFHELIFCSSLYELHNEFDLGNLTKNSNLCIRLNDNNRADENNFFSEINQGEFVEVKLQIKLNICFVKDNSTGSYQLSVNETETGKLFNVWRREKISYKFNESEEFLLFPHNLPGDYPIKVKKENVRLLSSYKSDILTFADVKFKHFRKEKIFELISKDGENIHCGLKDFDFFSVIQEIFSKFNHENIFFSKNDDSSINILSSAKIISFLTHMILIKSREVILVNTLENKLKEKEESKNEINRVLERNNKKTFLLPKKFISAIRLKILDKLISFNSELSYFILNPENKMTSYENFLTSTETEDLLIVIYGNLNLDTYDKHFNIQEQSIALEPKLAAWLRSEDNLDKMNKISDYSKIVKFIQFNFFKFISD